MLVELSKEQVNAIHNAMMEADEALGVIVVALNQPGLMKPDEASMRMAGLLNRLRDALQPIRPGIGYPPLPEA